MKAHDIRLKFSNFFMKHQHKKISSSALIPQNDPTLLFANAGMNQFKDYFTGMAQAKDKRAVTIQKCVRAGGKHNDLENVGFTARHHTFFEMLGNFSFGDYFKKEAISMAWEFLTKELGIDKNKLLITVHESDDEARDIWHKQEGVPLDRIFKLGDKDNFWEMGEFGPCGPCTEIFYDHGEKYSDGNYDPKSPLKDEGRFVEIWNLVFMQFEKSAEGIKKLPKPSVDTGAGLERVAAAMQGVYWNYDTDLFQGIIKQIEKISQKSYSDKKYTSPMRVIADHVRAAVMLISDGALPSHEGRGYVLRRIIRRGIRNLNELGLSKPSMHLLVPSVIEILSLEYNQLSSTQSLVEKILLQEETSFRETLSSGLKILSEEITQLKNKKQTELSGQIAFKLYDTFGFPPDLTETILKEQHLTLDYSGYQEAMNKQKENSRKNSHFKAQLPDTKIFFDIKQQFGQTQFVGYDDLQCKSKVVAVIDQNIHKIVITEKTPFYAESGGQVADQGNLKNAAGAVTEVLDVQSPIDGLSIHYIESQFQLKVGDVIELIVNEDSRKQTTKNHSATHLLQAALIKTLGNHVRQSGSSVHTDRLRFDFTHTEAVKKQDLDKIEKMVNTAINQSYAVQCQNMNKEDAVKKGAMALFGEKYGDVVRVISMGDFSTELCGGTHVQNTKDIQLFTILSESSLSAGVRRIEATTATHAFAHLKHRSQVLSELENLLSTNESQLKTKIQNLMDDIKIKNKELDSLKQKNQTQNASTLFTKFENIKSVEFYSVVAPDKESDLRTLSDVFSQQKTNGILFITKADDSKVSFILRAPKNTTLDFSKLAKALSTQGARAGGKNDMIQGSFNSDVMSSVLSSIKNFIGDSL